jgi:tetratricopeptide (TPR) repeat protein
MVYFCQGLRKNDVYGGPGFDQRFIGREEADMIRRNLALSMLVTALFLNGIAWGATPAEIFGQPGRFSPRDLYKQAHEAFSQGDLDGARLLALRIFMDGFRSQNLCDLLGALEIKAGRPLLAREWLRMALCLNPDDSVARKIILRLPPPPRAIPMETERLPDHFAAISRKLPILLARLTTSALHFNSTLKEIERGQFYKALALAEEYEKRYPGVDGNALTALCAYYLGRGADALQLVNQGLAQAKHHTLLLFLKAMIEDNHPKTSATSLAVAHFFKDRWSEAEKAADALTRAFPREVEGLLIKARIAFERFRFADAERMIAEAAKRDSDHPLLGIVRAGLLYRTNRSEQAMNELKRAFRRGYNLPSISLQMGLLAARSGQAQEAMAILQEHQNAFPFLDRWAYPAFSRLAIETGNLPAARKALAEWQERFGESSDLLYHEAFFYIKAGDGYKSLDFVRRAFRKNPDRLPYLQDLVEEPLFDVDPELGGQIRARLQRADGKGPSASPALRPTGEPSAAVRSPASATTPAKPVTAAPAGPTGERLSFQAARDVAAGTVEELKKGAFAALDRLEEFFGERVTTIPVELSGALEMGSRVAWYDVGSGKLKISGMFLDASALKTVLESERPDIEPSRLSSLLEGLPTETLVEETAVAFTVRKISSAAKGFGRVAWMVRGLAQIIGNEYEVLRDRLRYTQGMIAGGQMKLLSPDDVNGIFSSSTNSPLDLQNANTHAYLMTSFLLKRGTNLPDGVMRLLKMIELTAAGQTFEKALLSAFGLSMQVFDSGWKDAAYWSLQQGVPYEW